MFYFLTSLNFSKFSKIGTCIASTIIKKVPFETAKQVIIIPPRWQNSLESRTLWPQKGRPLSPSWAWSVLDFRVYGRQGLGNRFDDPVLQLKKGSPRKLHSLVIQNVLTEPWARRSQCDPASVSPHPGPSKIRDWGVNIQKFAPS